MARFFTSQFYMTTTDLLFINQPSFVIYFAAENLSPQNQTLPLNGTNFDSSLFPLLNSSLFQNFVPDLRGHTSICVSSNHTLGSIGGESKDNLIIIIIIYFIFNYYYLFYFYF